MPEKEEWASGYGRGMKAQRFLGAVMPEGVWNSAPRLWSAVGRKSLNISVFAA